MNINQRSVAAIGGLTVLIVAGYVTLLRTNSGLIERVESLRGDRMMGMVAAVGSQLPVMYGIDMTGDTTSLSFPAEQETLLLVFSSSCPLCDINWPIWEALAERVDHERFRLAYANLSDGLTSQYLSDHQVDGDAIVFAKVDATSAIDLRLSLTPLLIHANRDGLVQTIWPGVTREGPRRRIEEALDITLTDVELAVPEEAATPIVQPAPEP